MSASKPCNRPTAVEIHVVLNEASRVVTRKLKKVLGQEVFTDTVTKVVVFAPP